MRAAKTPQGKRLPLILEHVLDKGSATAAELAELTGVSLMTAHRDIEELTSRGLVRKYHGGVSALPSTVFESSSEYRTRAHAADKSAIARVAVGLIEPGMSVMVDDSTTALALAGLMPRIGPLTVVTNFRQVIETLREVQDVQLLTIGGEYSRTHDSFLGVAAVEAVERLTVDLLFTSTSAMTPGMTFHQEQTIVPVKRAMIESARAAVLLMDASKLSRTALYQVAPTSRFAHVVLGPGVDSAVAEQVAEFTDVRLATAE